MIKNDTADTKKSIPREDVVKAPPEPHFVQRDWLGAALGRNVRIRLLDGKSISGRLTAFDTYTLAVEIGGTQPHLIFKQAIAYITRGDAEVVAP